MTRELIEFAGSDGNKLVGSWSIPDGATPGYPLVILATGDGPSGSNSQTWTQFVPMLNDKGLATFLFDFAGLGHSPGSYRDLTLTIGCRNFRDAMQYVSKNGDHNKARIGVIGSSFGGNVALLEAASFPQIAGIGLKSASTFLPEGYEREIGSDKMVEWASNNYLEEIDHTYEIVEDSLFHNTYEKASKIKAPVRIVHGTADSSVPIRHARDLLRVLPNGTIFELDGADHWYAEGDEWVRMANNIVDFLAKNL